MALSCQPPCLRRACQPRRSATVRAQLPSSDAAAAALRRASGCAVTLAASALLCCSPALASRSDYGVYFVSPAEGATVASPVLLKLGVKGLEVRPAAEGLVEGSGHHHVLIDGPNFVKPGGDIPFDATHVHLGKGQTEASLALAPGRHTLTLQFANANHKSFGRGYAKVLHVNVTP